MDRVTYVRISTKALKSHNSSKRKRRKSSNEDRSPVRLEARHTNCTTRRARLGSSTTRTCRSAARGGRNRKGGSLDSAGGRYAGAGGADLDGEVHSGDRALEARGGYVVREREDRDTNVGRREVRGRGEVGGLRVEEDHVTGATLMRLFKFNLLVRPLAEKG